MFDFLRPSVPISKSFMRIPRISGILCGIWPQRQRSFIKLLFFGFNVFVVALGAVGENRYGFMYLNDLVDALEAFCPGVTKAISLFKLLVFFVYNHRWYAILQRIRTMLMAEQHSKEKMKIVQKLSSIAGIFSFILLISGSFTNMFFNIRPLMENIIRYFRGQDVMNVLPFKLAIPKMFVNYPYYPLTYLILTLSGAMTVFTFSFVDGFFFCACMYMSGVFRMIQYDIRIIFAELKEGETSSLAQNQRIRLQLAAVVKHQNAVIDLCTDFAGNFSFIILMHFLSAALVLCLSILDLMLNSASLGLVIYIFYSIAAMTQLFLYCIGGSYISESVWMDWKASVRKKIAHNSTESRATGGGPFNKFILTKMEETVGQLCGIFTVVEGVENALDFGDPIADEITEYGDLLNDGAASKGNCPTPIARPQREKSWNHCMKDFMQAQTDSLVSIDPPRANMFF